MSEQLRTTAGTTSAQYNVAATNEPTLAPRSKGSVGNVLTPIDIMNKRQAREAAKEAARRAEAGEIEEPRRSYEESQRRSMERQRTQAALVGSKELVRGGVEAVSSSRGYEPSPPIPGDIGKGNINVPSLTQPKAAPQPPQAQQQQHQQARDPVTTKQKQRPEGSAIAPVGAEQSQKSRAAAPSFPHAFERWEELSGKWEGLTSYWIRRLETNQKDVRNEPSWAQAQREITDLASAGANLFQAVVELQRLRASSERKFQRWFWETREQQEYHQEKIGTLQRALAEEQNARLNAPQVNVELIEARLQEMRREQQISSDEARRAWEELGRREQADRDVQAALRQGRAVMIGGIQVVPTQAPPDQSGHSQHGQQHAAYPHMIQSQHATPIQQTVAQSYHMYDQGERASPTDTDPFSGQAAPQSASRPHTSYAFQGFPSGPSPPPIGSMRAMTSPPQQPYPGMSPSRAQHGYSPQQYLQQQPQQYLQSPQQYPQQYYTPQQYPVAAQQYPFPTPGGMPPSTMPFYHQPGQHLHQPPPQSMGASPSGPRYQPYVESEGTSEVGDDDEDEGYELDPSGLDPPPPPGPASHPHHSHPRQSQRTQDEHHHQAAPGSPEQSYASNEPTAAAAPHIGDTYLDYGSETGAKQAPQAQPRAISSEDPLYDEPADYEGQGYGSEAAEWEGIVAHQHHATRLSDVLEAEEESLRSPQSTRSSRIPGQ